MTTHGIGLRCWLLMGVLLLTLGTGAHAAFIPLTATLTRARETPPNRSTGMGAAAFVLHDAHQIRVLPRLLQEYPLWMVLPIPAF
jgi:hypothetical protein